MGKKAAVSFSVLNFVSEAWMTRKISVLFEGEVSHTGPTPMANRRDALRAAARAIEALYSEIERANAGAHAAAARISVFPNSPNVVAGRVRVWFEVRHEDDAVVLAITDRFLARIEKEAGAIGVQVSMAADERRAAHPCSTRPASILFAASLLVISD